MRTCPRCETPKPLADFGSNSAKPSGTQTYCTPCRVIVNQESYQRTKHLHRDRRMQDKAKNIQRNREFLHTYLLEHPCVDCGEPDPVVLQFDHLGDKVANICDLVGKGSSIERISLEIAKGEVVCANCHCRRTARAFGWWKATVVVAN